MATKPDTRSHSKKADPLDAYSADDVQRFKAVEAIVDYKFHDYAVLRVSLTHSSAKTEEHPSNERMEFVGDAVLGLIVSERLYDDFPDFPEGELTRVKSVAVSRMALAQRAKDLGLAELMFLGKGIRRDAAQKLPVSILANLYEAVLYALYSDGGLEAARKFVEHDLGPLINSITDHQFQQNYKSALQHLVQSRQERAPVYRVAGEFGPDHQKEFHVMVKVGNQTFGPGLGRSKKEAEQRAAKMALAALLKEYVVFDEADDVLEVPVDDDEDDI